MEREKYLARGGAAVMAGRVEPPDALDDFPTPPSGTRALYHYVLPALGFDRERVRNIEAWEPAANRRIMADVMYEYHDHVFASDVHYYGHGSVAIGSFVGEGPDVVRCPFKPGAIVTNPPFRLAAEFAERAMAEATEFVALLLRTQWIESEERYDLFKRHPLRAFAPFAGRLPMVKGRWDPEASTATSYSWFVWTPKVSSGLPVVIMIPPDARARLSRASDIREFASRGVSLDMGPLFERVGT